MEHSYYYDKLLELYKFFAEREATQYTILITVILVIFVAVLGINFLLNKYRVKLMVDKKVKAEVALLKTELEKTITSKFTEKEEEIFANIKKAEIGIYLLSAKFFEADNGRALYFISYVIGIYQELSDDRNVRITLDTALRCITLEPLLSAKQVMSLGKVKEIITSLPELVGDKKDTLMNFLGQCTELLPE